ncbi:hypothetical protein ACFO5X_14615 [Seohaeicola nanhaiensis]|uniref:Uncharacterized protein n=1 Tax=Seohaeicola nanhaiensis TaxID=1387282 RepID=A0ABV9KIY1_9RHOB
MTKSRETERPKRETDQYLDDAATPGQQGRAGGDLERKVGTRDMLKRATQDRPGATRVRKADEKENDDG